MLDEGDRLALARVEARRRVLSALPLRIDRGWGGVDGAEEVLCFFLAGSVAGAEEALRFREAGAARGAGDISVPVPVNREDERVLRVGLGVANSSPDWVLLAFPSARRLPCEERCL